MSQPNLGFPSGKFLGTLAIILLISIVVIIFSNATFITIDAGERGVLFRRFSGGLEKDKIYSPGFHVFAPWNSMYIYNVREQQLEEQMDVLSSNGLNIRVDVTVRAHPSFDKIPELHETFGKDFISSLIRPEVRSSVRKIIGRFTPEELYSTKREEVQTLIQKDLETTLAKNFVNLRAALIREISLPEKVRTAIEEKIQAEQLSLKFEYILDQEKQESERKIIEAKAKAESNRILTASLSDKILADKGIEATLKLANSPNSKIIIIGSGANGLPLILGNQN